mmetsp:Transcript_66393/g.151920  ORF Transcript_66393/g.151920 Transcript_66393/m.151920 type:complete len:210 (-) Transcript_66393:403-1032(-)
MRQLRGTSGAWPDGDLTSIGIGLGQRWRARGVASHGVRALRHRPSVSRLWRGCGHGLRPRHRGVAARPPSKSMRIRRRSPWSAWRPPHPPAWLRLRAWPLRCRWLLLVVLHHPRGPAQHQLHVVAIPQRLRSARGGRPLRAPRHARRCSGRGSHGRAQPPESIAGEQFLDADSWAHWCGQEPGDAARGAQDAPTWDVVPIVPVVHAGVR